jgi:tetratricopeptide (TPR) repeat protein
MKKHIILSAFLMLSMASCEKFLDKKSNNTLITPITLTDLQALLDDANNNMNQSRTSRFGAASTDDYFLLDATFDPRSEVGKNVYLWKNLSYQYPNDWASCYQPVYIANYCLEKLGELSKNEGTETERNNIKGSALFFRAYYFLSLVFDFGKAYDEASSATDLGIALRLSSDFNIPSKRSSVRETYERIINDCLEAESLLPNLAIHPYRPSKASAYGLLARAYLSMRDYGNALKYAKMALLIKNDLLDYNNTSDVNPNASLPFKPFNKEVVFETSMGGNIDVFSTSRALVDSNLYKSYLTNDLRKTVFFQPNGLYQRFKGTYSTLSNGLIFSGIATDELYLISAECNARLNQVSEAILDLNTLLRKRWKTGSFTDLTTGSQAEALELILLERRKELLFRGLRWIDIKRFNKEGQNMILKRIIHGQTYTLAPNHNYYALPLPDDIIRQTGMPQNPN